VRATLCRIESSASAQAWREPARPSAQPSARAASVLTWAANLPLTRTHNLRHPSQARHIITPATDEEYDHALAHHPHRCRPFAAALGDRRPARRCRAEYPADAARETVAALAAAPAGRARLARLADAVAAAAAEAGGGWGSSEGGRAGLLRVADWISFHDLGSGSQDRAGLQVDAAQQQWAARFQSRAGGTDSEAGSNPGPFAWQGGDYWREEA
jgi:hypothetical protein